jgi:hypothetical protein
MQASRGHTRASQDDVLDKLAGRDKPSPCILCFVAGIYISAISLAAFSWPRLSSASALAISTMQASRGRTRASQDDVWDKLAGRDKPSPCILCFVAGIYINPPQAEGNPGFSAYLTLTEVQDS